MNTERVRNSKKTSWLTSEIIEDFQVQFKGLKSLFIKLWMVNKNRQETHLLQALAKKGRMGPSRHKTQRRESAFIYSNSVTNRPKVQK